MLSNVNSMINDMNVYIVRKGKGSKEGDVVSIVELQNFIGFLGGVVVCDGWVGVGEEFSQTRTKFRAYDRPVFTTTTTTTPFLLILRKRSTALEGFSKFNLM